MKEHAFPSNHYVQGSAVTFKEPKRSRVGSGSSQHKCTLEPHVGVEPTALSPSGVRLSHPSRRNNHRYAVVSVCQRAQCSPSRSREQPVHLRPESECKNTNNGRNRQLKQLIFKFSSNFQEFFKSCSTFVQVILNPVLPHRRPFHPNLEKKDDGKNSFSAVLQPLRYMSLNMIIRMLAVSRFGHILAIINADQKRSRIAPPLRSAPFGSLFTIHKKSIH